MAVSRVRHVRVADEVWARWAAAAAERRVSVAQLVHAGVELLLVTGERDLVGHAVFGSPSSAPSRVSETAYMDELRFDPRVGSQAEPSAEVAPPALPRRRLARREMCEHRVPPTSFCKECDA